MLFRRWVTLPRMNSCISSEDRVQVSLGEAPSIEELRCTNVAGGKLGWGSFLARSERSMLPASLSLLLSCCSSYLGFHHDSFCHWFQNAERLQMILLWSRDVSAKKLIWNNEFVATA